MKPVKIAAVGIGNRMRTYMEYVRRHPQEVELVAVADTDTFRRNTLADQMGVSRDRRFSDYHDLFRAPLDDVEAVFICTPDALHYEPTMLAIRRGWHVLLEKPIAQTLKECLEIDREARERGVLVGICHVLRYYECYRKVKQLVQSGQLGRVMTISHVENVGIDRATHSYVRGIWNDRRKSNPMLLAKCCHDVDFLFWITNSPCRRVSSFGCLTWFRPENAPEGSAERCINCSVEDRCPFSAVDLYLRRHDWISNFDVPEGKTLDDVLREEMRTGRFGRCVYHCDNNVVDHQTVMMELENQCTINLSMDVFTQDDGRSTDIMLTEGEIKCTEDHITVRHFRTGETEEYDYKQSMQRPHHGGADLALVADFIHAVRDRSVQLPTLISDAIESHAVCYAAERSRAEGRTVSMSDFFNEA